MSKVIVCGRGGSGKSTVVALVAKTLGEQGKKVLVVDTDESNLGLTRMMGQETPAMTLMGSLGGKAAVREKLLTSLQQEQNEKVRFFRENLSLEQLSVECVDWNGPVGILRIGKIEHTMEGCACPMGSLTRSLLNELSVSEDEWVIVDTEAGVEHFGRGILEGADTVLMVADPSYESVLLTAKARELTLEANKKFIVILNKLDINTEPVLRGELNEWGMVIGAALNFSAHINRANLIGSTLNIETVRDEIQVIVNKLAE